MSDLPGASVWERELYEHLMHHMEQEGAVLGEYQKLTETAPPAFAYLAGLILDDERRHHALLRDLAETIRLQSTLTVDALPIPDLGFVADAREIVEQTQRLLEMEQDDVKELQRLERELKDVRDTTLWALVVEMMKADNNKHQQILKFILARAKDRRP